MTDTDAWYNANAVKYSKSTLPLASTKEIENFVGLLKKGDKILDAGCGSGRDTAALSALGYATIGIDLSPELVKVTRMNFPDLDFREGNMLDLKFADASFDAVWAHASLVHFEKVEYVQKTLSEFNRVLKPEGKLHVSVKAQTGDKKFDVVSDVLSGHDRFFQYFTQPELQGLIINAGFNIIELTQEKETDTNPKGRPEVEWLVALGRKKSVDFG